MIAGKIATNYVHKDMAELKEVDAVNGYIDSRRPYAKAVKTATRVFLNNEKKEGNVTVVTGNRKIAKLDVNVEEAIKSISNKDMKASYEAHLSLVESMTAGFLEEGTYELIDMIDENKSQPGEVKWVARGLTAKWLVARGFDKDDCKAILDGIELVGLGEGFTYDTLDELVAHVVGG